MMQTLTESAAKQQPAQPCILIIFGITGDLTKRLLYPAICNLGSQGLLDENFRIIGLAKEKYSKAAFRKQLKKDVKDFVIDSAQEFGYALVQQVDYISGFLTILILM